VGAPFESVVVPMADMSRVGEARRAVAALAATASLPETDAARAQIVTTELGTNLVKHAREGVFHARQLQPVEGSGLELVAIDRGPGMDVERCLVDGYSTAGTPGTGLGAARRLSDLFEAYSLPAGSVAAARIVARATASTPRAAPSFAMEIGAVCLAMTGETICGDAWAVASTPDGRTMMVVADGLGHGPLAADASATAIAVFHEQVPLGHGPAEILAEMHRRLRSTRGAAVAVAEIALSSSTIRFSGLGNVAATVIAGASRRGLVSHNGTAGATSSTPRELTYPFPPGALLIMASDGLGTHWDLGRYPGVTGRHPALVSSLLCRDFSRGRDDLTVVSARERSS
jgi:anti-sigma regulatory factor (Ser/Thr protein kinase)